MALSAGALQAQHVWDDSSAWWNGHFVTETNAPKYTANELSLDLFGSYMNPERKFEDLFQTNIRKGRWGGGAGLNYFLLRYVGVGADVNLSDHPGRVVDQVLGNGILRLPIGETGLAPYVYGGGGRSFYPSWTWTYDAGAGLEFRFNRLVGIFSDASYIWPDHSSDRLRIRAGLRLVF